MLNTKINLNKNKGFTLVELLVVIIILSVISSVSIPVYLNFNNKSKESATKIEMSSVAKALSLFQADNEVYPSDTASLSAYLKSIPAKDSFKIDYVYEASDDLSSYTFTSFGIDKTEGTGDDIVFEDGIMIKQGKYAVAEEEDSALFESDFADMSGLKVIMGIWNTSAGYLKSTNENYQNRAVFGDESWQDYEIKTTASLIKGDGYGIYYRLKVDPLDQDKITGYIFQYDPRLGNKFVVRKVTNGYESNPIQSVDMPSGFSIFDTQHELSISVEGNRHIIKVDGANVMDFNDSSFASGQAGFRSWGYKTDVSIYNTEVNSIP